MSTEELLALVAIILICFVALILMPSLLDCSRAKWRLVHDSYEITELGNYKHTYKLRRCTYKCTACGAEIVVASKEALPLHCPNCRRPIMSIIDYR